MNDLKYLADQMEQLEICEKILLNNSEISKREAILKKCQVYLALRLYQKAFTVSESILKEDPYDFKGHIFKVRSLFGLGKYSESVLFLRKTIKFLEDPRPVVNPQLSRHLKSLKNLIKEGEYLLEQQTNGLYEMSHFVPNRKVRYDNVSEFKGPIEIGTTIPGKGRGIIATEDLSPGQLLLVSRAFEIVFDDDEEWSLEKAIAQKLTLDPSLSHEVYQLHAGKDLGYLQSPSPPGDTQCSKEVKPHPLTSSLPDMDRIIGICTMNSFGNSRNTTGYGHDSRGLWILPSFMNHDCIDFNCIWKCLGDLIFIRSLRHIPKGQELLISYTDSAEPWEERLKFFKAHDFICQCRLCTHQMKQDSKFRKKEMDILQNAEELSSKTTSDSEKIRTDIEFLENAVKELEIMGVASGKPEWNFSVHLLLDELCKLYLKAGNNNQSLMDAAEKYYKIVNGCPTEEVGGGGQGSSTVCLEVGAAGQVAAVFLKCKHLEGATKWIDILKKDLTLVYGSSDVFKLIYPILYSEAVKNGINC